LRKKGCLKRILQERRKRVAKTPKRKSRPQGNTCTYIAKEVSTQVKSRVGKKRSKKENLHSKTSQGPMGVPRRQLLHEKKLKYLREEIPALGPGAKRPSERSKQKKADVDERLALFACQKCDEKKKGAGRYLIRLLQPRKRKHLSREMKGKNEGLEHKKGAFVPRRKKTEKSN